MRRGNLRDLYPQTFELIQQRTDEAEELISGFLNRSDEEEFYPLQEIEKVVDAIVDIVDHWVCFNIDFPKENLDYPNHEEIIEDYLRLEGLLIELEESGEHLVDNKSKLELFNVYSWIIEIKEILE